MCKKKAVNPADKLGLKKAVNPAIKLELKKAVFPAIKLELKKDTFSVKNAAVKLENTKAGRILEPVMMVVILLICTAYLVDGSFSPFLYFRF